MIKKYSHAGINNLGYQFLYPVTFSESLAKWKWLLQKKRDEFAMLLGWFWVSHARKTARAILPLGNFDMSLPSVDAEYWNSHL